MKTMINIKTDKDIKLKAQKVAEDLGLPLGTILNAYLRELIRTKEAHFGGAPRMSDALERLVAIVEKDIKNKKNFSPVFSNGADMDKYLDNLS
ncbi:MAG: type II toxin-antitoxin system RelB/DinJ family antitoxin [Candidatus Zambryskibacteria bacterium]|nr:type II toxin-antitoxin system RelB/DinJ family antitoxin [Candidatus Zambryskibacteria bacterium]